MEQISINKPQQISNKIEQFKKVLLENGLYKIIRMSKKEPTTTRYLKGIGGRISYINLLKTDKTLIENNIKPISEFQDFVVLFLDLFNDKFKTNISFDNIIEISKFNEYVLNKENINNNIVTTPKIQAIADITEIEKPKENEINFNYEVPKHSNVEKLKYGKVISKSISEASAEIAIILVQFLKQLHISSDYVRKSSQSEREKIFFHQAPCFASFSKNEIVSQNQKIIASAQRRVAGALLQHGSIKINGIKHHDALALNNVKYVELNEIEKLTHSGFESCLPLFFTTFSNVFSAEVRKGLLSENEKISLKKRETAVRNKSLEKRELIKQNEY